MTNRVLRELGALGVFGEKTHNGQESIVSVQVLQLLEVLQERIASAESDIVECRESLSRLRAMLAGSTSVTEQLGSVAAPPISRTTELKVTTKNMHEFGRVEPPRDALSRALEVAVGSRQVPGAARRLDMTGYLGIDPEKLPK